MNCAFTAAKLLLVIFNAIFWAFGIAILGIGIWLKVNPEVANYSQAFRVGIDEPVVEIVTWVFIGAGIFVLSVGFVCFIGVIRKSKIILGFYIVCVFIVFVAEVAVGGYAGVRKQAFELDIAEHGADYVKTKYTEFVDETSDIDLADRQRVSKGFNYIQQRHECCGVSGWRDYNNSLYLKDLGPRIRPGAIMSYACCQVAETQGIKTMIRKMDFEVVIIPDERDVCMREALEASQSGDDDLSVLCSDFTSFRCKGCMSQLLFEANKTLLLVMIIGIVIGVIQLFLMILALFFCLNIKDEPLKEEN